MQREYFWKAKGLLLEGKRTTFGRQKDYFWKVKGLQLEGKSGLFAMKCKFLEKQKNCLPTSTLS